MAKRKRHLSAADVEKLWKEGRGQGDGKTYKPWLTIQDVPSQGQVNRVLGWKTKRIHHLLSQNELRYFYLLEWSLEVADIREQFPLWPHSDTEKIADDLSFKHPESPGGGIVIMTTDFLITLETGEQLARTVKMMSDLKKPRVIEKLEIEREYWQDRRVNWGIIIADDLPLDFCHNIEWIHSHLDYDRNIFAEDRLGEIVSLLTREIASESGSLAEITTYFDQEMRLPKSSSLGLARHLIATRQWQVNMNEFIDPSRVLRIERGAKKL